MSAADPTGALIRPEIARLPPYNAGLARARFRSEYGIDCLAKLDSNENPFGPSPACIAAIAEAAAEVAQYPDAVTSRLREMLGERTAIPAGRIVVGNGSEDLIGAIYRAVLRPGDRVVTVCPSFGLHELDGITAGANVLKLNFGPQWQFPVDEIVAELPGRPRILIFSSPANPAGPAIDEEAFAAILAALSPATLFVFDEAYVEFSESEWRLDALTRLAENGTPWISLRTFSKAYGLAGARVGYALCGDEDIAQGIMKTRNPFAVNSLAIAAAQAALEDDGHMRRSVRLTGLERRRVVEELAARGFAVAPSQANFLFFHCGTNGAQFAEALRHEGILIKGWAEPPYEEWARVTIGLPEQNDAFLAALDRLAD